MIAVLLAALQVPDLILYRGCTLSGPFAGTSERYWDVSEAEIDAGGADLPFPTLFAATGAPQRKVLLRFGSLDIATLRDSKIVDGTLDLGFAEEDKKALKSIRIIRRPWLPAGVNVVGKPLIPPPDPKNKDAKPVIPFIPGVTWKNAGGDVSPWAGPGLTGPGDADSLDAKISYEPGHIRIGGLGSTLQAMKMHEGDNFGFLLEFSTEVGINSVTAPESRPRLELKLEKATVKDPHLVVSHDGASVNLSATEPINSIEVFKGTKKISTEKGAKIPITPDNSSKDPRGALMKLVVNFDDPSIPQEVVMVDPSAPWVKLTPKGTRIWNSWKVDQSFYSFARMGAQKYVNGEGDKDVDTLPVPELAKFASGSTMMDTMLMAIMSLPLRSTRSPLYRQVANVEGGALTAAQVDYLMHGKVGYPTVVVARIVNIDNRPIDNVTMKVVSPTGETSEVVVDENGTTTLPRIKEGTVGDFTFSISANGRSDSWKVPSTALSDAWARSQKPAVSIELPFNLPLFPITDETNLAQGKPVKDSAGSFPAQLIGLVDDNPETTYKLPAYGWVEVDLGRDRLLGEIAFAGDLPSKFRVKIYGTTDKIEDAFWWIDEVDSGRFRREYGDLLYRPTPNTGRYVRIENLTKETTTLKGLRVIAVKKT